MLPAFSTNFNEHVMPNSPDPGRPSKRARNASTSTGHGHPGDQPMMEVQFVSAFPNSDFASTFEGKGQGKKPPLSCAECRRLKLKCDRVFPCQSCTKRGCGEICPEGSLTSGKGSRFILKGQEQLHAKIAELCDRVRQLEEALETLQAASSKEQHPLLRPELLTIKTTYDVTTQLPDGAAPHLMEKSMTPPSSISQSPAYSTEETASVVAKLEATQPGLSSWSTANRLISTPVQESNLAKEEPSARPRRDIPPKGVPEDIFVLSKSFPSPWSVNLATRERIRGLLPTREHAEYLCQQAVENGFWQYNLDPSESFLPNMIRHVYTTPLQSLNPRRLALVLMVLAIGSRVDLSQSPNNPYGDLYHHLARAAMCELPILHEANHELLHVLFYLIWYYLVFAEESSAFAYAWTLMGLAAKLAQSFGLHRDTYRSKMIPEEVQGRRMLFWELLNLDARLALCLGRPPSLSLSHVECRRPSYSPSEVRSSGDISYHSYKHEFYAECLSPILEAGVAAHPPEYETIVDLDRKVRNHPVPPTLNLFNSDRSAAVSHNRSLVMQQGLVVISREIALLQMHRPYFTRAVSSPEPFTMQHKFMPSVLATLQSSRELITAIEALYKLQPALSSRISMFWFNSISLAVGLCLFVSRVPSSSLAPFALQELLRMYRLLRAMGNTSGGVDKALPLMAKLAEKSHALYMHSVHEQNAQRPHLQRKTTPEDFGQDLVHRVHPSLWHCLHEAQLPMHGFDPRSVQGGPDPTTREGFHDTYSLSELEEWYIAERSHASPRSASGEDRGNSRVPNPQTLELDFGTLTVSDLETQSWMSLF